MTVNTLLRTMEVTRNTSEDYIVNIFMHGYGKPMSARVDKIRVHKGAVFIVASGQHDNEEVN